MTSFGMKDLKLFTTQTKLRKNFKMVYTLVE